MTTTTDFAPITLNGEPVLTWRMMHNVQIGDSLFYQEDAAFEDCECRRCMYHDDFGGCIVAEALWGCVMALMGR